MPLMQRHDVTPRPQWQHKLERLGFDYHSMDGSYWQEAAAYRFDAAYIDRIEAATNELHQLCLHLVGDTVQRGDYDRFGFADATIALIEASWRRGDPSLYGRFDLVCTPSDQPPKLLEYNADTPTALFEASVVQWYWLQDNFTDADQFNGIHEHLIAQWRQLSQHWARLPNHDQFKPAAITLATITDSIEDTVTCRYLQDTAVQAGLNATLMDLRDLGWLSSPPATSHPHKQPLITTGSFVDIKEQPIAHLFKLYPWEWLLDEPFAAHLPHSDTMWVEPIWKLLLSSKALLPLLWQRHPNHPNLLPSYVERDKQQLIKHDLPHGVIQKPMWSREGANISWLDANMQQTQLATSGAYGHNNGGWIYQAACPLPRFMTAKDQAVYPVVGSWVIGDLAAGMGIREDNSPITKDTSHFVPHYFYP